MNTDGVAFYYFFNVSFDFKKNLIKTILCTFLLLLRLHSDYLSLLIIMIIQYFKIDINGF